MLISSGIDHRGNFCSIDQAPTGFPLHPAANIGATAPLGVSCGVIWTGSLESLRRQDLGCSDQPLTSVVTLADGRVMIAGNTDLWIRG